MISLQSLFINYSNCSLILIYKAGVTIKKSLSPYTLLDQHGFAVDFRGNYCGLREKAKSCITHT
jgi:hypothetical protein